MITLFFFVLSGLVAATPVPVSADFLSAYQVLKKDYSYVIDRLMAGEATETEIEKFLVDLERNVKSRGDLTEANFNSIMYRSFEEVIQWPKHKNVFYALLESYGDEIKYTLEYEELHPDLLPIRNAVAEALLGGEEDPPSGGGNSGGSSGGTISPEKPANVADQSIFGELTGSGTLLSVDLTQYEELVLPGSLINQISHKGKTLELKWTGMNLVLPPGAIAIGSDDQVKMSVKKLTPAREAEGVQRAGAALNLVGDIYEIAASTGENPQGVLFNQPIGISLKYSSEVTAEAQNSLALYFYNEKNQHWEKLIGEHDLSSRYIKINTNQPGQYALFAAAGAVTDTDSVIESKFIDIKGHWAEEDINTMYQLGLISGVTAFQFEPERHITRAEFAAIMLRAMGEEPKNYMTGRFYDVPADAWYFNTVNRAAEIGIISGYSASSFGPQDSINREQIAAIISRAMQLQGKGTGTDENNTASLGQFADQHNISSWARSGVAFAVENQIVMGRGDAQFAPLATATRAEAAAMILRMYKQL